jgi:UDP-N-acetylglucosamine 2-epimerase
MNNNKMKVITFVGTRPEIIKLSRVISKLDHYTNHFLVHTGQNYDYELNEIFFKDLNLKKPSFFLECAGKTSAETIGKVINNSDKIIKKIKPDAVLILGDTNSCLSVISAKRNKIPIFHMEAGNRCYDERVPEEINRKIVDHISDINLPYSEIARECLLREGFAIDRIIKTGSPMQEVINFYKLKIQKSKILKKLKIKKNKYIVVSIHREENIDLNDQLKKIVFILNDLTNTTGLEIIFSVHPRTKERIQRNSFKLNKNIRILKPLCYSDYNKLQINSKFVISDSGTINEEASILNFPAINLRETHERHEANEEQSTIMTGLESINVKRAITILSKQKKNTLKTTEDYLKINVSEKVIRCIHSYTDYINRNVWKKN